MVILLLCTFQYSYYAYSDIVTVHTVLPLLCALTWTL